MRKLKYIKLFEAYSDEEIKRGYTFQVLEVVKDELGIRYIKVKNKTIIGQNFNDNFEEDAELIITPLDYDIWDEVMVLKDPKARFYSVLKIEGYDLKENDVIQFPAKEYFPGFSHETYLPQEMLINGKRVNSKIFFARKGDPANRVEDSSLYKSESPGLYVDTVGNSEKMFGSMYKNTKPKSEWD